MLADLDETLRLLVRTELQIKNGEIDIRFDQPTREWSTKITRPTINLFLYDVRENTTLRQHQWQAVGNGSGGQAQRKRTPFRFDCSYMLTTWTPTPAEPEDEHNLLAYAVLALLRNPVLREDQLVGSLKNQPVEVQAQLGQPTKLTNPAEVWGALDNEIRPTIPYVITVALDPWTEISGPIVRTVLLRTGQAVGLPDTPALPRENIAFETAFIGGAVRNRAGEPQAAVTVALRNTGYLTTTDRLGRFTLRSVPPGAYTLVAWGADGKPRQREIAVPASDGDYDITL